MNAKADVNKRHCWRRLNHLWRSAWRRQRGRAARSGGISIEGLSSTSRVEMARHQAGVASVGVNMETISYSKIIIGSESTRCRHAAVRVKRVSSIIALATAHRAGAQLCSAHHAIARISLQQMLAAYQRARGSALAYNRRVKVASTLHCKSFISLPYLNAAAHA